MYYLNRNFIVPHNCDECKNKNICKDISIMKDVKEKVKSINEGKGFFSNIKINVSCDNFEKQIKFNNSATIPKGDI